MKIFKPIYLYVKISSNSIEVTNLITGETLTRSAVDNFSTNRIVISSFNKTLKVLNEILNDLNISVNTFFKTIKIVIQQMEILEGGLSDIELRALRDVGEQAGAKYVTIINHSRKMENSEALIELQRDSK